MDTDAIVVSDGREIGWVAFNSTGEVDYITKVSCRTAGCECDLRNNCMVE